MQRSKLRTLSLSIFLILLIAGQCAAQASMIASSHLITTDDLAKLLQAGKQKPLMFQVGSHVLFTQAHIPNSEYVGAGGNPTGLQQLRERVNAVPKNKFIVLYCGCCPWGHCPNVKPADDLLNSMGFTNVKVLYIPNNFGADWVAKGYPTAQGE